MTSSQSPPESGSVALRSQLTLLAAQFGFQQIGVSHAELDDAAVRLRQWLALGHHGEMGYMAAHGSKRWAPAELVPGTISVLSLRMDYWPEPAEQSWTQLRRRDGAYISRYALGRDYHKLIRRRLQQLAIALQTKIGAFGYRVFVDSAPVLEKPLAELAGLGWIGKHTNLINSQAGSYFFLGEIYTDLPLAADVPATEHCGSCSRCITACPTAAIVAPFQLDARRCISYHTIELDGPIPVEFRAAMGNRIYGCDDCQLVCPWNKFARLSAEPDFQARHGLDCASLIDLFAWSEADFLRLTEGSAIRRIGYRRWLRNIAVALGNAARSEAVLGALHSRRDDPDDLVREHVQWALAQHDA